MKLFGFDFGSKKGPDEPKNLQSFQIDRDMEADYLVPDYPGAQFDSLGLLNNGLLYQNDEQSLISSYREIAASSEIDEALQEIRNEIFVFDVPDQKAISLEVNDRFGVSRTIAKKIAAEFESLYEIIEFDHKGLQYFDDWYIDGKLYAYKMVDEANAKKGIQKIQLLDPLNVRRVKIIPRPERNGTFNEKEVKEFYVFSNNFDPKKYKPGNLIQLYYGETVAGLQINPDAMTYVHSGLYDRNIGKYVGYLKKAIAPYNNLKMMEDSMVIFRIVRAPSRRAIYIDVAGLQKNKAEEYMKSMMAKHRNKMTYDAETGALSDRRNVLSMLEDYWLPRRTEGKTTEIQQLDGQSTNDILEEVNYFRDKLWRALNVPRGRFGEQANTFVFGKTSEIQRDEYRFKRYLNTLRSRFILFFEDLLKTQLILKKVITESEWEPIRKSLEWIYAEDNAFVEYKEAEILQNRLNNLAACQDVIGKFRSYKWAATSILRMTELEFKQEQEQIKKEKKENPDWFKSEQDFDSGRDTSPDAGSGITNKSVEGSDADDEEEQGERHEQRTTAIVGTVS